MSEQIDWSKAPEGYPLWITDPDGIIMPGWHKEIEGKYVDMRGGFWNKSEGGFTVHKRPTTPSWSGEGLPPVGVVCEFKSPSSGGWLKARIIFVSAWTVVLYVFFEHDEHCYSVSAFEKGNLQFRPIRTPEQIAADERDKAAHDLFRTAWPETHSWGDLSPHWQEAFYRLADAGFRKP